MIIGCQHNDRKAQQQLFEALKQYVTSICYRYAYSEQDVKDLTIDSFMRVFTKISSYNLDKFECSEISFKAWIKRVVINNCINYNKKFKYSYQSLDALNDSELQYLNFNITFDNINYNEIIKCVRLLPKAYKIVFQLYVIDGYSHQEIAGILNISTGTSKSNLFKAREHLKKIVEKNIAYE